MFLWIFRHVLTVKLRYKQPDGEKSVLLQEALPAKQADGELTAADADFRWAAAVASFGMQLRSSQYAGQYTLAAVDELAKAAIGEDPDAQRAEFLKLVAQARELVQAASEATQPEAAAEPAAE